MAASSPIIVCVITSNCFPHKRKQTREFVALQDETCEHLERKYACTEKSQCQINFAAHEQGPWTTLSNINNDAMHRLPIAGVLASFNCKYIKVECVSEPDVETPGTGSVEPERKSATHCIQHTYCFQIQKCEDVSCCKQLRSATKPKRLPDPTLDDTKEHFKPLHDVLGHDTTEADRPSFKTELVCKEQTGKGSRKGKASTKTPAKNCTKAPAMTLCELSDSGSDTTLTAQTARVVVECVECRKLRVVYAKIKLSQRQSTAFATLMSEYDYTCGSPITPPGHSLHDKVVVRMGLTCQSPMEAPFYSSDLGRLDVCYYCGGDGGVVDLKLKQSFKTVFPICTGCGKEGYTPCCMRPYGKAKANTC